MKVKHVIVIFLLGVIFVILGSLFKINHWPGASKILLAGMILEILGLIMVVWKLFSTERFKDFLNQ
jgi:hypothetical protein